MFEASINEDDFIKVKNALLDYYTSQLTAQSARLIGFSVALFTLLEIAQNSSNPPLSSIFSSLAPIFSSLQVSALISDALKFLFLLLAISFVLALVVHTLGRFSVFAQLSYEVLRVTIQDARRIISQIEQHTREQGTVHHVIHRGACDKLLERDLGVFFFKTNWFTGETHKWRGLTISLFYGTILALLLLWFLW